MTEYGIFNAEGCVEAQFYSVAEAEAAMADRHAEDDEAEVCEVCPDHEEQPRDGCEECAVDGAEDDDQNVPVRNGEFASRDRSARIESPLTRDAAERALAASGAHVHSAWVVTDRPGGGSVVFYDRADAMKVLGAKIAVNGTITD